MCFSIALSRRGTTFVRAHPGYLVTIFHACDRGITIVSWCSTGSNPQTLSVVLAPRVFRPFKPAFQASDRRAVVERSVRVNIEQSTRPWLSPRKLRANDPTRSLFPARKQ
jgi:hypothetical protein